MFEEIMWYYNSSVTRMFKLLEHVQGKQQKEI